MTAPAFGSGKPDLVALRQSGQLWDDFATFARAELACQDVDPAYPVLARLQSDMSGETALWHTFLYVAFYNIASSEQAFAYVNRPNTLPDPLAKLPTGIERRGFRDPVALNKHLASLIELADKHGSLGQWLGGALVTDETGELEPSQASYIKLREDLLRQPWGNGRWAAYKTAEILQKVNRFPATATDMGNDESSGPVSGLKLLWGDKPEGADELAWLDELGWATQDRLREQDINVEIDVVETLLCDFHSLAQGRYYVGHDIDMMAEQLSKGAEQRWLQPVWRARAQVFEPLYLVEITAPDEMGVSKDLCKAYSQHGQIVSRKGTWS